MSRPTTASIDHAALRHNLARVRALAPDSKIMAVVKADGYGHGLERVARAFSAADGFGVASLADAERLRAIGLDHRIVLLSGFNEADDLTRIVALKLDTVVHHESQLQMLEQNASIIARGSVNVWLKVETGMHRLGIAADQVARAHARLRELAGINEITLMTHLASSDEFDSDQTMAQLASFAQISAAIPGQQSIANSAAVLGWPGAHNNWVRAGGMLYGLSVVAGTTGADFGLQPAMTLSTRLLAVNQLKAGDKVGYGGAWTCPEQMPVGIAAVGYGDGYPRHVPSGTPCLIDGKRAAIIGRVSMDLMCIDLRDHRNAQVGDAVVLWGPELPPEIIADAAETISYELTCSITRRVNFVDTGLSD